ncbi:MAG TPA: hypothetical protein VFA74_18965 [Terriglobales bacterium]|nr:hypothetical protein [Terriglobales bacterium]
MDYPLAIFIGSLILLWAASRAGTWLRGRLTRAQILDDTDFNLILGAILTLLGLIIGFTFSMAVSRYDQRKNYEEQEANAIGTEYLRLDVLQDSEADKIRALLREYLDHRIAYYSTRESERLREIRLRTAQIQSNLWAAIVHPAIEQPHPVMALVLSGMNDVLNSEGYSEAAWRNRIPTAAWILLLLTAVFCNGLLGYHAHAKASLLLSVLPVALAISFFLIAEIDSPRSGLIRVHPQNLESLADSLRPH